MIKSILALVLVLTMITSIIACAKTPEAPEVIQTPSPTPSEVTDANITRGQWIDALARSVANDVFLEDETEAFFSDIDDSTPLFNSVQTAVVYNWIDTDSETFSPNSYATRSFVAATTAKALGLVGEPDVELTDIAGEDDSVFIRLAVDSGILSSSNGIFNPSGTVTVSESNSIIQKVSAATGFDFDPNHEDVLVLEDNVVALQIANVPIVFEDPNAMTVSIPADVGTTLEVGTVYILPPSSEFPNGLARKVRSIERVEDRYIIENEIPAVDEVITELDIQGEYEPDLANVVWASGVTGVFENDVSMRNNEPMIQSLSFQAEPRNTNINDSSIVSWTFEHELGFAATLDIHTLRGYAFAQMFLGIPLSARVYIEEAHTFTFYVEAEFSGEIPIAKIPFPIKPGLSINVLVSVGIDGTVKFMVENSVHSETWFSTGFLGTGNSSRTNIIENSWDFNVTASAGIEVGLIFGVTLNLFGLDLLKGAVFIGVLATAEVNQFCADINLYFICYLNLVLLPKDDENNNFLLDLLSFTYRIDVFTPANTPLRYNWHIENGVRVEFCTRGGEDDVSTNVTPDEPTDIYELWALLWGYNWINDEARVRMYFDAMAWQDRISYNITIWGIPGDDYPEFYGDRVEIEWLGDFRYNLSLNSGSSSRTFILDISEISTGIIIFSDMQFYGEYVDDLETWEERYNIILGHMA